MFVIKSESRRQTFYMYLFISPWSVETGHKTLEEVMPVIQKKVAEIIKR